MASRASDSTSDGTLSFGLNGYFGRSNGRQAFEEMAAFRESEAKSSVSMRLVRRNPDTFGATWKTDRAQTYLDEAIKDGPFRS